MGRSLKPLRAALSADKPGPAPPASGLLHVLLQSHTRHSLMGGARLRRSFDEMPRQSHLQSNEFRSSVSLMPCGPSRLPIMRSPWSGWSSDQGLHWLKFLSPFDPPASYRMVKLPVASDVFSSVFRGDVAQTDIAVSPPIAQSTPDQLKDAMGPWPLDQDSLNNTGFLNQNYLTATGQTVPRPSISPAQQQRPKQNQRFRFPMGAKHLQQLLMLAAMVLSKP